ncbi:efflux transporter outer membrane subunit [Luteibacter sp. dw_328]|uniref:efflux transporter outer membrane subunit n=1 Tax=Luteibacter sp. dw_328 TaxID=2719796 RepID=UPI00210545E0|nr:efflux transporter outer membrane subunit [Luteibacter sp. dw_328]
MKAVFMGRLFKGATAVAATLILAACSLAPAYHAPSAPADVAFKEASPSWSQETATALDGSTWKAAMPSEEAARGEWWKIFNDAVLDKLERQALEANQDLKAAAARVKEARALNQVARSAYFPTVDAGLGATRQQPSAASQGLADGSRVQPSTVYRAQADVSYEVDLFGRVASSVDAARADTQRSEALFRSVQLALQADVAQNYFALRELDAEGEIYANAVALREDSLKLLKSRFAEGYISEVDVLRAESDLSTARSAAMTAQRLRAASEHSLAVLLGKTPAEFTMPASPLVSVNLRIPAGLPSSLLERRPDIAAAERAMAAANARIGVAKSAFFPSLSLTGTGGSESSSFGNLFKWSSRSFLLGPLTGTALSLPLFDGGKRKGDLANAKATYEEQAATYQQQVLLAFREVEDNLATLRILEEQTRTQDDAVASSTKAASLLRAQYTEGQTNYLDVLDAQRTVLGTRRDAVQLEGLQAIATVNLIRALGGGWDDTANPAPAVTPVATR